MFAASTITTKVMEGSDIKNVRRVGRCVLVALACLMACCGVQAQGFRNMRMPNEVCAGTTTMVTFGFRLSNTAVIYVPRSTLGFSDTIFLPDGPQCATGPCSYHSSVTFMGFSPGATITSVNDIKYVRLNIEHSYIGDIYIGMTCPSGQHASIKYVGSGIPACLNIPNAVSGSHPHGGALHFGIVVDPPHTGDPCDSTAEGNEPGVGWNYCWSERPLGNHGYYQGYGSIVAYAPTTNYIVDSSNVTAMSNFFHPDGGFSSLVGCPLNGVWTIDVVDVMSQDNGYLFSWDLALDETLMPTDSVYCPLLARSLTGPWLQTVNDSLYYIHWPAGITVDTTVSYTFQIITACGDTVDSTVNVVVHPRYINQEEVTMSCPAIWHDSVFTTSTTLVDYSLTVAGCDSITRVVVNVTPAYEIEVHDTVTENELPVWFNGQMFISGTQDFTISLQSVDSCDSVIYYWLHVYENQHTILDSAVCYDELPLEWNGVMFDTTDLSKSTVITHTLWLLTADGADSVVEMRLTVWPVYDQHQYDTIYNGSAVTFGGMECDLTGVYTLHLMTAEGCDSTVTLHLRVWPRTVVDSILCQSQLPLLWNDLEYNDREHTGGRWQTSDSVHIATTEGGDSLVVLHLTVFDTSDTYDIIECCDSLTWRDGATYYSDTLLPAQWLTNRWGCDSLTGLELTVYRSTALSVADTICYGQPYQWHSHLSGGSDSTRLFTLVETMATLHGCDSAVTMNLVQLGRPLITFRHNADCLTRLYRLAVDVSVDWGDGVARAPYFRWSSSPDDPLLEGYEADSVVTAAGGATYFVYADYRQEPLCPTTSALRLNTITVPSVALHVTPDRVKYERRDFDAYDVSIPLPYSVSPDSALQWRRQWYIDWLPVAGDSAHLHYEVTESWPDSVLVGLQIFNGVCRDTVSQIVPFIRKEMWIPNAFTPDRDDNQLFVIVGIGIIDGELYVYNREGLLVYHTSDYNTGWDGRDNHGRPCGQGSYVWKLIYHAVDFPSAKRSEVGTVTLIR